MLTFSLLMSSVLGCTCEWFVFTDVRLFLRFVYCVSVSFLELSPEK
jgi:hypothetical protein